MKRIFLILVLAGWILPASVAQITITRSDMPLPGDSLRVSITNNVPDGFRRSAMDTTWNFSMLEPLAQRVDTFSAAIAAPAVYQLVFVMLGGANLASPRGLVPVAGFPVSQGFTFYKNSDAAFEELGSGYMVQGFPLPVRYDVPEKIYQFPATPGDQWNSASAFALTLPSLGYYGTLHVRHSTVDGWGMLTTPYGTFQTLRVKSEVTVYDTVHIDSLGAGFSIDRVINEYRWLANGQGVPVLQINEENSLATAVYRDIARMQVQPLTVSLGPDREVLKGTNITLEAEISGGVPPYQVLWSTMDTGTSVSFAVTEDRTISVLVFDALQNFGADQVMVTVKYPPGIGEQTEQRLTLGPVPVSESVRFRLPFPAVEPTTELLSMSGKVIETPATVKTGEWFTASLSGVASGMYLMRVTAGSRTWTVKLPVYH